MQREERMFCHSNESDRKSEQRSEGGGEKPIKAGECDFAVSSIGKQARQASYQNDLQLAG